MSTPPSTKRDRKHSSAPTTARFSSDRITIGAGVAIFHLASQRVVVCYHSRDEYWFLPKGRRNASEETGRAAEREGFEEVSFAVTVWSCVVCRVFGEGRLRLDLVHLRRR